jgi:regulator of replication initiation timing
LKEENQKLQVKNQNLEERLSKFEEIQNALVKQIEQLKSTEQLVKN